ncbi:18510_t:CDS:2, partial [Acaulospora morrowiae]
YGITQDTTGQYMIVLEDSYFIRYKIFGECAQCGRYNTSEAWCQSCDTYKATQGWTSGNKDIDNCIKEIQLKAIKYENVIEWIPFNRLSNLQKVDESRFQALWLDGIRKAKNYTRLRTLPCSVELKKFDCLQVDALEFIRNNNKVYGITQDTTGQYMIVFEDSYFIRYKIFGECTQCERYNTSTAWCQSCDPFKTTQGWTSGNKDVDNCIKEVQLEATEYEDVIEWIPFNRLSEFRNIGETEFQALWLDGIRKIKNNTQSRALSCSVELKKFNGLQADALEFIRNFKNCIQLKDSKHKIYGITQDTTGQYMIVLEDSYFIRYKIFGECAQCERYNTSEAWCQSCDPFKTTEGWTSGNNDIDNCIKEFQLKTIKYENVIEWIPFNRLSNLQKVDDESRFQALWLDGVRKSKNHTRLRTLPCLVELKKFDGLQVDALEFIRNFKYYIQSNDLNYKVHGITQHAEINQYMIVFSYMRYTEYGGCKQCKRHNTAFTWCRSCDHFKTTQVWTSGNNDIDNYIKEIQLKATDYEDVIEWIPFNRLFEFRNIGGAEFQALWLDGIRKIKNNTQSRTSSCIVELKKFNGLQVDALEFIRNDIKHKIYGITRDTAGQYMIVWDDFYSTRCRIYGECAQCERYNTSEAWCQSCDPYKTTQGWTSGNNGIDNSIKELQLSATRHEDVIEWISFNRLINLRKIGETTLIAIWLDGIRKVENNAQSRSSSHIVELKALDNPQINALNFIRKFKNQNKEYKVYGITQDISTQYMVVVNFTFIGDKKITQGWTSESINIDNCIKEFQSIATEYDEVIEWISFDRLSNIREIGKGGFGCVYSAIWLDGKRKILNNGKEFIQSRTQSYTVALKLCPVLKQGTPDFYVDFANLCMNSDPQKRPTAKIIFQKLEKWYGFIEELDEIEIDEDDMSVIDLDKVDEPEKVEISNKFWESDEIVKQLPITLQKHQDVTYTSQFIDTYYISQQYNKLVKSDNLSQQHDESIDISTT